MDERFAGIARKHQRPSHRLDDATASEQTYPWEPSYGFTRTDPVQLAAALEAVRRRVCSYGPTATTCDCKYGLMAEGSVRPGSEQTGCPELRSVIRALLHPGEVAALTQALVAVIERSTT